MNKSFLIIVFLIIGNISLFGQKPVKYKTPDGIVSAILQKHPDLILQKLSTEDSTITLNIVYAETDFATQMISYYRYPLKKGESIDDSRKSKIISEAGEKFTSNMKLKVDKREHIEWFGADCIQTTGYDQTSGLIHRIFMIKDYVFQVVIIKPSGMASEKEIKTFFGHIKINKKKL